MLHGQHIAPGRRQSDEKGDGRRPNFLAIGTGIFAFVGMVLMSYSSAAAWLSQYNQSQVISGYGEQLIHTEPDPHVQLVSARRYNEALRSGALLEAHTNVPTGDGVSLDPMLDYSKLLSVRNGPLMARLRIPAIDVDLPVYHGTSDDTLLAGIGHLRGTSLPVGGTSTRSVLTGHRGLASAEMFTNLDQVKEGDTFSIDVFGETLTYRVYDTKVVEPNHTEAIRAEEGRDLVTLVTCTPLGVNSHRILVTGERVFPTPQKELARAARAPDLPRFPWWMLWMAGGSVLIGAYIWRIGFPHVDASADEVSRGPQP